MSKSKDRGKDEELKTVVRSTKLFMLENSNFPHMISISTNIHTHTHTIILFLFSSQDLMGKAHLFLSLELDKGTL